MKRKKKLSIKAGLPPGTPVYMGTMEKETEISIIDYDPENYQEIQIKNVEPTFRIYKTLDTSL